VTTLIQDDITGDLHRDTEAVHVFGLLVAGDIGAAVDIHEETLAENPEAVADQLHEFVDEWLEQRQEFNAAQDEAQQLHPEDAVEDRQRREGDDGRRE